MLFPFYCRTVSARPVCDRRPLRRPPTVFRHRRVAGADGTVTAETAVLLPVLLVVLAACIGVLASVAAQLRCVDAARAAARVAARGEAVEVIRSTGERLAPPGARVTVQSSRGTVQVVVRAQVRPFGQVLRAIPPVAVSGRAVAASEVTRP